MTFFGLVYCFIVCLFCSLALHNIFHTPMAQYSLFVLKAPLNNQSINQTLKMLSFRVILILLEIIHFSTRYDKCTIPVQSSGTNLPTVMCNSGLVLQLRIADHIGAKPTN